MRPGKVQVRLVFWDSLGCVRPLWDALRKWDRFAGLIWVFDPPCWCDGCVRACIQLPRLPVFLGLDPCVPSFGQLSFQVYTPCLPLCASSGAVLENLKGWCHSSVCSQLRWDLPSSVDAHYVSCILHNCSTGGLEDCRLQSMWLSARTA